MKVIIRLINWMTKRDDWISYKGKLELGNIYSENLDEHIRYFKLVAMCMGLTKESRETKQLFLDSVKHLCIESKNPDGSLKTFDQIVSAAIYQKKQFNRLATLEKGISKMMEETTAAAAMLKRTRDELAERNYRNYQEQFSKSKRPVAQACFKCGGTGHIARNCTKPSPPIITIRKCGNCNALWQPGHTCRTSAPAKQPQGKKETQKKQNPPHRRQELGCVVTEPEDLWKYQETTHPEEL